MGKVSSGVSGGDKLLQMLSDKFWELSEMDILGDKVTLCYSEITEVGAHRILKHWLLVELYY